MIGTSGTITINGAGFAGTPDPGVTPTVNLPPGFTYTLQSSTDTSIVVNVSISYDATIGPNSISVTAYYGTIHVPYTTPSVSFLVDGPNYLVVVNDNTIFCPGCATTVQRDVKYQVMNASGSKAGSVLICEAPTWPSKPLPGSWSCMQTENHGISNCGAPGSTFPDGTFTDSWTMTSDIYTPVGCGFDTTDRWMWVATTVPTTKTKTICTLNGFIHTDSVSINGVLSPQKIATGTVCLP
jgi:hypothetical protein